MSLYKYPSYLQQSGDQSFDNEHGPGTTTPHSALYRCMACGREIVSETGRPFPPQNHHQHPAGQGSIRWRMTVYPVGEPQ